MAPTMPGAYTEGMAHCPVLPLSRRKRFITRLHHCGPPVAN